MTEGGGREGECRKSLEEKEREKAVVNGNGGKCAGVVR